MDEAAPHYVFSRERRGDIPVVVKSLLAEPGDPGFAALPHEYALLGTLDVPGVVRPLASEERDGRPVLVLEDAGASNLGHRIRAGRLDVGSFLELAIEMSAIVARVHGRNVIHRSLSPASFVLDDEGRVTLVGFDLATTVTGLVQSPRGLAGREATLPYLAPEQTGRMKRLVDHRADLYSLGAVFYEMLVGTPPFNTRDPLELVHAHLARTPIAPALVDPRVPRALSDVVLKLLAKAPEWRYQTAEALHADLVEIRRQWLVSSTVSSFELGRLDRRELPAPAKVYGRECELRALRSAFARCRAGSRELVVVRGSAGIGKSALVHELRDSASKRGRFVEGKCVALREKLPLMPFVDALRSLALDLGGDAESCAEWGPRIQEAVFPNGRVLTALVPELAPLIGEQPPLTPAAPGEAVSRARHALVSFIRAIARPEHPLLLFVDDLQWADPDSIALLVDLATEPELGHLLLVVSLRGDDLAAGHPALRLADDVARAGGSAEELELGPLDVEAVGTLLADTLRSDPERVRSLAEIVAQKSAGNPFFVQHFLRYLQMSGLLAFDIGASTWRWDVAGIARAAVPENVVDLLVSSIRKLPASTHDALKVAACIGSPFDVSFLAGVLGRSVDDVAGCLWIAIRLGLLVPVHVTGRPSGTVSASYRFLHDRIHEAIYDGLPDDWKTATHLEVGRRLLEGASEADIADRIFEIVNHLNLGAALMTAEERARLIELDELAARKAVTSSAFAPALGYLRDALAQLPADALESQHELAFRLHRDAAAFAFLSDPDEANRLVDLALAHARSRLERVELYEVRAIAYGLRGAFLQALHWGREGLRVLGVELPDRDLDAAIDDAMHKVARALDGRAPEALLDDPGTTDPEKVALQRVLTSLFGVTFFLDAKIQALVVLLATHAALEQGVTMYTPYALSAYGVFLGNFHREYATGHAFGHVAVELSRRSGSTVAESSALIVFGGQLRHWRAPLRSSVAILRDALGKSVRSGKFENAAAAQTYLPAAVFSLGAELERVRSAVDSALAYHRKIGSRGMGDVIVCLRQALRCLSGWTAARNTFEDDEFVERDFLAGIRGNPLAIDYYSVLRLQCSYLLGDLELAREMGVRRQRPLTARLRLGNEDVEYLSCTVAEFEHRFYLALTLCALARRVEGSDRVELLAQVAPLHALFEMWAENCPENFRHKHSLISAELASLAGRQVDAEDAYHRAIQGAAREGFLQDEAIAHELCGRAYLELGLRRAASSQLQTARDVYARWGATAKVAKLDEELAGNGVPPGSKAPIAPEELDVITLFRAAETLASEVVLDRLLEKLMTTSVEAAGAERAVLLIEESDAAFVRAEVSGNREVSLGHAPLDAHSRLPLSIIDHVRRSRHSVILGHAAEDGDFVGDVEVVKRDLKSVLAVPIRRQAQLVGVLYFENNLATYAFTPERVRVFELLSGHMAVSLENSLLFAERERAAASQRFLAEAGAILAESLDYELTLSKVAQLAVPSFADWCVVDVVEGSTIKRLAGRHADPARAKLLEELAERYPADWSSSQPASVVLRTGEPRILEVTSEAFESSARDAEHARLLRELGVRAVMVVPLVARSRTIGTITFVSAESNRRYGEEDLELAQELARRAAMAIESARLYRESREALRSAQEALRLRDEFLTVASHELRTPLTSLQLFAEGVRRQKDLLDPDNTRRAFDLIERQIGRLRRLVDDLLSAERIGGGRLELRRKRVDLAHVVREAVARSRGSLDRAGCVLSVRAAKPVVGLWDPETVDDVVTHLLDNAIKFGAGTPIEISVEQSGEFARLVVTDHGIGIPEDRLPHIFDRFGRGVPVENYGGLGLGLFVVRAIVEAHGGTIRAEATRGGGATFTVELPRTRRPAIHRERPSIPSA